VPGFGGWPSNDIPLDYGWGRPGLITNNFNHRHLERRTGKMQGGNLLGSTVATTAGVLQLPYPAGANTWSLPMVRYTCCGEDIDGGPFFFAVLTACGRRDAGRSIWFSNNPSWPTNTLGRLLCSLLSSRRNCFTGSLWRPFLLLGGTVGSAQAQNNKIRSHRAKDRPSQRSGPWPITPTSKADVPFWRQRIANASTSMAPRGAKNAAIVVFVHGGEWTRGGQRRAVSYKPK